MTSSGRPPDFSLLETMRLDGGRIVRLREHLARMAAAARAHGFAWSEPRVAQELTDAVSRQPVGRWRVRLLLADDGTPAVECLPFPAPGERPWIVALAAEPVDEDDPLLRVKTTRRTVYDDARRARPHADDVILWTRAGEITESTIANVVVEIDGTLCTPPATLPLLPGVFREELLRTGRVRERAILKAEALSAPRVWLVNSLREWTEAEWTT
jgi:para-aminobenzoate synthetase / 4-amino-4-deoxychorismate lyase